MPISPPEVSTKRYLARKLVDAAVGQIPLIGGPLAAIYSVTHPAQVDLLLAQWQEDVSAQLNSMDELLNHLTASIVLSEDAACLGIWMAQNAATGGRADIFRYEEVKAQFPTATNNEMLEAVGELEFNGLITTSNCLGNPFSSLRPHHKLFEVFDPVIFDGISPRKDASTIALELLNSENSVSAESLCAEYDWDVRRINPALMIVGDFISDRRKSCPLGQPYTVQSMFVSPIERASLRQFVKEVEGQD